MRTGRNFVRPGVTYPTTTIVLVLLWAALHDRPVRWACQPGDWGGARRRPWELPSPPTMSRRQRDPQVAGLTEASAGEPRGAPALAKVIDGKPLPVGGGSKDPDAKAGRGAGGLSRGYKLHAVWGGGALPDAWGVRPLNVHEVRVARELVPRLRGGGYLVGDARYDAGALYERAARHGHQLVAPRMRPGRGRGHRRQSPHRLRGLELARRPLGRSLPAHRRRTAGAPPGHRARLRPPDQLRRGLGAAARLGPPAAPRPPLGLGQAPDQRRPRSAPTYGINEKCSGAVGYTLPPLTGLKPSSGGAGGAPGRAEGFVFDSATPDYACGTT